MKFLVAILLPGLACAAIFPENIGAYHRTTVSQPRLSDRPLWNEYGLKDSETAAFENGSDKFTATVYRLQDSTGALAAFDWQRPADARASNAAELAASTESGLLVVHGNYLFSFEHYQPSAPDLMPLFDSLRDVDTTPLPGLPGFMPADSVISNSERYVIGPAGLAKFDPGIPPSVAAFHLGAEAQIAAFSSTKGPMTLALFDYPTNQMAQQKDRDFQAISGAMVKRSGPLIAVVLSPADPDAAERLLAKVRYEAQVTLDERVPTARDNPGTMLINIFILTGILIVFCLVAGLFVGGFRVLILGRRRGAAADPMILLHLEKPSSD